MPDTYPENFALKVNQNWKIWVIEWHIENYDRKGII